jgi:hypothetical protein
MVPPVKFLEENISELANEIVKTGITSIVTEMLNSTIGNIDKFTSSAELQFTSTLLNSIVDTIEVGMESPLAGIEKLLQFFPNFTVGNTLRSGIGAIQSLGAAFDKNQSKESMQGLVTEWMIGANPIDASTNSFKKVLESMNLQKSGSKNSAPINVVNKEGTNLGSLYSRVSLSLPVDKNDTTFKILFPSEDLILGSVMTSTNSDLSNELITIKSINKNKQEIVVNRSFAGISTSYPIGQEFYVFSNKSNVSKTKKPLVNKNSLIVEYAKTISAIDTRPGKYAPPPIVKIFGGGRGKGAKAIPLMGNFVKGKDGIITGGIIGFEITDPGSGYTIPPFVEIVDDTNSPQGYGAIARSVVRGGKVVGIYIISEGENYTLNENKKYSVKQVIIENSGNNYSSDVNIVDQFGNIYPSVTFEGRIIQVDTLNNNIVTDKPILTINSEIGSGAIFKTIIGPLSSSIEFTETQQVVDCPT